MRIALLLTGAVLLAAAPARADEAAAPARPDLEARIAALEKQLESSAYQLDILHKKIDDVLWFERVGDVAEVDKVYYTGPPNPRDEQTYGIASERHPFKVWAYVFVPRGLDRTQKAPLLLLPHGGVHGDFDTYYTHIVRELMAQGYVVVAPEYRGSTGYGRDYQEAIDYGGLEVADVVAGRDWAVASLPFVDPKRVGILGWSHGGLIALMATFDHPDKFQVAFAGVPVSDLLARMGYQTDDYRALFSAPHHIGKPAYEDVAEYRRRSPAWNAAKLRRPLLIHATTNDRDVNIAEVEHLIAQLRAAGKDFQYRIYQDAPGGHSFDRIDTPMARQARQAIYAHLARYLGE